MADEQKTKAMRLKPGRTHVHDGKTLNEGDVVELTDTQQRAFGDKFEATDAKPAAETKAEPDPVPAPTTHVRQDVQGNNQSGAKTPETAAGSVQQPAPNTAPPVVTPTPPTK